MVNSNEQTKEFEAQAALVCGEAFQRVAAELIPKISIIKETSVYDMSNELGDLAVCATSLGFAIELYLKSLLMLVGKVVPKSHDLGKLYDKIPVSVKEYIEDVYNTKRPEQVHQLRGRVSFTLAKGPLDEPQWDDCNKVPLVLTDLLARSRDLFQSWRYVCEYRQPRDGHYQFHQFEYALLWCAAEAIRVEVTIRLGIDTNG
jgi:hypothetical protein